MKEKLLIKNWDEIATRPESSYKEDDNKLIELKGESWTIRLWRKNRDFVDAMVINNKNPEIAQHFFGVDFLAKIILNEAKKEEGTRD